MATSVAAMGSWSLPAAALAPEAVAAGRVVPEPWPREGLGPLAAPEGLPWHLRHSRGVQPG